MKMNFPLLCLQLFLLIAHHNFVESLQCWRQNCASGTCDIDGFGEAQECLEPQEDEIQVCVAVAWDSATTGDYTVKVRECYNLEADAYIPGGNNCKEAWRGRFVCYCDEDLCNTQDVLGPEK